MARMLQGEVPVNSSTISDVNDTLKELAENGSGEVKITARFVLDGVERKKRSESETGEQIENFKDYCRNYVG